MIREFPGARATLAARRLPQPDQMCGPFAAAAALEALVDDPPGLLDIAAVAGTMIWPHDAPESRPPGTVPNRDGWNAIPEAPDAESAGTTAAGLATGIEAVSSVRVVPATGPDFSGVPALLDDLLTDSAHVSVIANVATGPIVDAEWNVGHFVVVWGLSDDGRIALADSYRQLGDRGLPPGCRLVDASAFAAALSEKPGRGLLLLTHEPDRMSDAVRRNGLQVRIWHT